MQYRKDQYGNDLPILGFGCMRFPSSAGRIDQKRTEALILRAVEGGVNYFDTAYIYPGSENMLGEILQRHHLRQQVRIATKLPQTMCRGPEDFDAFFNTQKQRLRTDHIDYYLVHNITGLGQWDVLRQWGIEDWLEQKKSSGEIGQAGFSFHGAQQDFFRMLDSYHWDFVQIQYNYMNTHFQAGTAGLRYAGEKNIPVFIMEPLLGGRLASGLPKKAEAALRQVRPDSTQAQWAFRWLWDQSEVTLVLSGMNDSAQLEENLALADASGSHMFSQEEHQAIARVTEIFQESYKVPCTGCNYCMPCPQGLNIPACFSAYNTSHAVGWFTGEFQYCTLTGLTGATPHLASDCTSCGTCERRCPQGIQIRKELKRVRRRFECPGMKGLARGARWFLRR